MEQEAIREAVLVSPVLSALDWLEHGFATRHAENWFDERRLAYLKQIHSDVTHAASNPGNLGEGDALITDVPGLLIGVRTADCLPILIADPTHRAVAAIHAGWRGSAEGIVLRAIAAMRARFGTEPRDAVAVIGPGIRRCCYEVGSDVATRFSSWLPELDGGAGKVHLDLLEVNRRQLLSAGLGEIHAGGDCTFCNSLFHSFRRDGESAGRMYSVIGIRSGDTQ